MSLIKWCLFDYEYSMIICIVSNLFLHFSFLWDVVPAKNVLWFIILTSSPYCICCSNDETDMTR